MEEIMVEIARPRQSRFCLEQLCKNTHGDAVEISRAVREGLCHVSDNHMLHAVERSHEGKNKGFLSSR